MNRNLQAQGSFYKFRSVFMISEDGNLFLWRFMPTLCTIDQPTVRKTEMNCVMYMNTGEMVVSFLEIPGSFFCSVFIVADTFDVNYFSCWHYVI